MIYSKEGEISQHKVKEVGRVSAKQTGEVSRDKNTWEYEDSQSSSRVGSNGKPLKEVCDVTYLWKIALTSTYGLNGFWNAESGNKTIALSKDTDFVKQLMCLHRADGIYLHSPFLVFYFPFFIFFLKFSLYPKTLLLASQKRTLLRERSYVIHNQWPITHFLSCFCVICTAEKGKRGCQASLLRIYGARRRNRGLHGDVRSEGAERGQESFDR